MRTQPCGLGRHPGCAGGECDEGVEQADALFCRGGGVAAYRAECFGAGQVRRLRDTFCRILIIRISCSAALLSRVTVKSTVNRG